MNLKRDLEFLYEVGSLRFLQRTWKQFLNPDFGNISEHIFRVTWIALILAKHEKARDHEKIIKMALIHDLPESRTGDVHYVHKLYTNHQEEKASNQKLSKTPITWMLT
jgi:putative hydrolase of HD superfamily